MDNKIKNTFDYIENELNKFATDNWDIFYLNDQSRQISLRNSEVEDFTESLENGFAIRLLHENRISMVFGNNFEKDKVLKTIENAKFILKMMSPDNHFSMNKMIHPAKLTDSDKDWSFFDVGISDKVSKLKYLENKVFSEHKSISKVEHLGFSESYSNMYYRTKFSDIHEEESLVYGFDADVIAEDGNEAESGSDFSYKLCFKDIDLDALGKSVAYNAYSMLHAKPLKSNAYKVVFRNDVVASFLSFFIDLFSAENIQNKKSILDDKIGQKIAASTLNLIDDGVLKDGLGTIAFDGEGTTSKATTLIKDGVLNHFLYNLKAASKDNTESTGNGLRGSYYSIPVIRPTNLILSPGQYSYQDLFSSSGEDILIINSVMGMHTSNRVNGDFSLGATGYLMRNGELVSSVKQFTIAGNFIDLLTRIAKIGNDVESFPYGGNILTPSLLFNSISVSGI
ncbi:MAG: hypothetical protein A2Y40_03505 [Candidatus Margulisbacteria bacterium GWF2_35_9]|nr:MAG: hypothetical protein A2Y40_03505 [Candidatus Margulisbacteria bacterium GWF2_35_9]